MEFRWLTSEEQRTQVVEGGSLSEVLAQAQQLQAEAEGRFTEEQVVEMGRELGVRPEYVREALRRRGRPAAPARAMPSSHPEAPVARPLATIGRAGLLGFGIGTFPLALIALANGNAESLTLFAFVAMFVAGWSARQPRLAGIAGALTVPATVLVTGLCLESMGVRGLEPGAFFLALLSFTPLGSAVGRWAARLRQRAEQAAEAPVLPAAGRF